MNLTKQEIEDAIANGIARGIRSAVYRIVTMWIIAVIAIFGLAAAIGYMAATR